MDAGGFHELFASGICGRLQPSLLKSPAMKLPERAPLTIFSNGMGHSGWANPKPPLWAPLRKGLAEFLLSFGPKMIFNPSRLGIGSKWPVSRFVVVVNLMHECSIRIYSLCQ